MVFWQRALKAFANRDENTLSELGRNDLVVRQLQLMLQ